MVNRSASRMTSSGGMCSCHAEMSVSDLQSFILKFLPMPKAEVKPGPDVVVDVDAMKYFKHP